MSFLKYFGVKPEIVGNFCDTFGVASDETNKYVEGEITKALDGLAAQAFRLTDVGLKGKMLSIQQGRLTGQMDAAKQQSTDQTRYDALRKVLAEAKAAQVAAKTDVDAQLGSAFDGTNAAIGHLRDAAAMQISKLKDDDPSKQVSSTELSELDKAIVGLGKIAEPAERRKKLAELEARARALFDAASAGDTDAVNATYEMALAARYGVTIAKQPTHANKHLDKVYKMFGEVPVDNVVHSSLKFLTYNDAKDEQAYGNAMIHIGDFGAKPKDFRYTTPTEGFSISTLHEVGHSIDDRFGIMDKFHTSAGCASWRSEQIEDVAEAFYQEKAGTLVGIPKDLVIKQMVAALTGGQVPSKPPNGFGTDQWGFVKPVLFDCTLARAEHDPWDNPVILAGGTRAYAESYSETQKWWSYDAAQRATTTVRTYQWRAPGEWFAELYAFSWFHKQPPPAIDPGPAAYMWKP